MFNLFFRARESRLFRARSASRDAEADYSRVQSVLRSIEEALKVAEAEHSGLNARLQDVLARAAISLGNGTDEYLTRESADSDVQNQFDAQITNGQRRLEQLSNQIKAFKFLRSALMSRFPDIKLNSRED
ncbi:MAG: hypothetical protein ACXWKP_29220 [Bradyrhizobium sp.]